MAETFSPSAAVPAISVLPFALLSAMPWSAPDWVSYALPLLPLTAIHFWSERRPGLLPPPVVLIVGLLVDLMTDGPLGYWAALFLLAYGVGVRLSHPVQAAAIMSGRPSPWLGLQRYALVLALTLLCGWLIACLYYARLFNPVPMTAGALLALALQPVIVFLLEPLARLVSGRKGPVTLMASGSQDV